MYDTITADVTECLQGGLAEKHNLTGWTVVAFWNPAGSGARENFDPKNDEHGRLIRFQRPLRLEFKEHVARDENANASAPQVPVQPLRHVEVKKSGLAKQFPNEDLLFQINSSEFE